VTKKKQTPPKKQDQASQLIDAALTLAVARGWSHLCVADIAIAAEVPIDEALILFPTKRAILDEFQGRIDRTVVENTDLHSLDAGMRDRLFDVLIRRFESLNPWKEGVAVVTRDTLRDPLASFHRLASLNSSMALMAECAGLSSNGLCGQVKSGGLTVIYLFALHRWLRDNSSDMEATMAELDRRLRAAEKLWEHCPPKAGAKNTRKTKNPTPQSNSKD